MGWSVVGTIPEGKLGWHRRWGANIGFFNSWRIYLPRMTKQRIEIWLPTRRDGKTYWHGFYFVFRLVCKFCPKRAFVVAYLTDEYVDRGTYLCRAHYKEQKANNPELNGENSLTHPRRRGNSLVMRASGNTADWVVNTGYMTKKVW